MNEKLNKYLPEIESMEERLYEIIMDVFDDPLEAGALGNAWSKMYYLKETLNGREVNKEYASYDKQISK